MSPCAASKTNTMKWSSKNDYILLVTGCGLSCHLLKHGEKSKKFECLAAAMHKQCIVFKSHMLQDKFEGLLVAACKEVAEGTCQTGYEYPRSEAKEEAMHLVKEADDYAKMKAVSLFVLFFTY